MEDNMNEADFIALYQAQMQGMYRMGMALLHHHADAQDAAQQAMLKAWAARDRARPGSERAWLMRIMINECSLMFKERMDTYPNCGQ